MSSSLDSRGTPLCMSMRSSNGPEILDRWRRICGEVQVQCFVPAPGSLFIPPSK